MIRPRASRYALFPFADLRAQRLPRLQKPAVRLQDHPMRQGGMVLMALGIIGEYLAKTYIEVKNRPLYVIAEDNKKDVNEKA